MTGQSVTSCLNGKLSLSMWRTGTWITPWGSQEAAWASGERQVESAPSILPWWLFCSFPVATMAANNPPDRKSGKPDPQTAPGFPSPPELRGCARIQKDATGLPGSLPPPRSPQRPAPRDASAASPPTAQRASGSGESVMRAWGSRRPGFGPVGRISPQRLSSGLKEQRQQRKVAQTSQKQIVGPHILLITTT